MLGFQPAALAGVQDYGCDSVSRQCSVSLGASVVLREVDKDMLLGDINCPVSRG